VKKLGSGKLDAVRSDWLWLKPYVVASYAEGRCNRREVLCEITKCQSARAWKPHIDASVTPSVPLHPPPCMSVSVLDNDCQDDGIRWVRHKCEA